MNIVRAPSKENFVITLAQLVERVKSRLKDEEFDDDQLKVFIDDAQKEVLGEAIYSFLEKVDEQDEVGRGELNLPLDYQQTNMLIAIDRDGEHHRLQYLPFRDFFDPTSPTTSINRDYTYTLTGGKLFFCIPKSGDSDGCCCKKLFHHYLATPKPLEEDADVPVIPEEYIEILELGALVRAEQSRDNHDFAANYENKQLDLIENMKLRYCPRQNDQGNKVRIAYGHKISV